MNKIYNKIVILTVLGLAAQSDLVFAQPLEKPCIAKQKPRITKSRDMLKTAVRNYILTYIALYSMVPVISARVQ